MELCFLFPTWLHGFVRKYKYLAFYAACHVCDSMSVLCETDTQFECQLGKAFMLAENGLHSFCALDTDAGSFSALKLIAMFVANKCIRM